ncbi:MAG: serine hydrolase domain-containing protein [Gemmatimonadales bacterium]|jgi:CubicO group peptidase (beta-lactamase class C family)
MLRSLLRAGPITAAALGIVCFSLASAQDEAAKLQLNSRIERELAPDQTHTFSIDVRSNRYMFASVEQLGIDVVVRILDPAGAVVDEVDASGERGTEFVTLFSDTSGEHRIEITPFDPEAEAGVYAITILRLEPAAATMSGRVDQLFAPWDVPGSPGAALAVARDGEIVYEQGYGLAQLEYEIPITPRTVFHVASVSKQFTAFAITMLADEGRLSLDDDIRIHLPEVPDFGDTITVRHLIHHTSGLRDQWVLLALAGWRLDDVITRDQIMRLVRRQRELNFRPGDEFLYCNTGYTLLAEIVERVTGQSFAGWMAENIFEPLGMTHTHFHDDHQQIVRNRAYSYARRGDGYRKAVLSYANVGATSLFTTVEDLMRWEENLYEGGVGGPAVNETMHTRGILNNGDTLSYAFGLGIGQYRGLRTVGHSGGDAGFRSYVVRFPEEHFAVAILSNLGDFSPSSMALRIADIFLADRLEDEEPEPAPESASEEEPTEERIEPFAPDESQLRDYVGEYYSDELGTTYTLAVREGALVATHVRHDPIALTPSAADAFSGDTWFFRRVQFERDAAGTITGFRVTSGRVRNLLFTKS